MALVYRVAPRIQSRERLRQTSGMAVWRRMVDGGGPASGLAVAKDVALQRATQCVGHGAKQGAERGARYPVLR